MICNWLKTLFGFDSINVSIVNEFVSDIKGVKEKENTKIRLIFMIFVIFVLPPFILVEYTGLLMPTIVTLYLLFYAGFTVYSVKNEFKSNEKIKEILSKEKYKNRLNEIEEILKSRSSIKIFNPAGTLMYVFGIFMIVVIQKKVFNIEIYVPKKEDIIFEIIKGALLVVPSIIESELRRKFSDSYLAIKNNK